MFKLIIIAMVFSGSYDGGASSNIENIEFETLELCEAAKLKIEQKGHDTPKMYEGHWRNYNINAYCVQTKSIF